MSDLHERLAALAEDAPVLPGDGSPSDLWRRGRRHRARRLLATGAATVVVAGVVGIGATAGYQRAQTLPEPAAPAGTTLVLPDTLYGTDQWLSLLGSIGEGDAPGPLVALLGADVRTWTGQGSGHVAVTADQEYRVLDLPDARADLEPVLSPDGRYVVYGDPDGLAAYDAETGEIDRIDVADGPDAMAWLGDTVLFQQPDRRDGGEYNDATTARAWTMGEDAAVAVDDPRVLAGSLPAVQTTEPVVLEVGVLKLLFLTGTDDLAGPPVTQVDRILKGNVVVSPDGTRIAAEVRAAGGGRDLAVGVLAAGTTELVRVPGEAVDGSLVGWRDDDTIVTTALGYGGELTAIDVRTGRQTTLTTSSRPNGYSVQLAADALTAPVVAGVAPPSPPDPRWVAAGAAALTGVLWVAFAWWRGRRRVRG